MSFPEEEVAPTPATTGGPSATAPTAAAPAPGVKRSVELQLVEMSKHFNVAVPDLKQRLAAIKADIGAGDEIAIMKLKSDLAPTALKVEAADWFGRLAGIGNLRQVKWDSDGQEHPTIFTDWFVNFKGDIVMGTMSLANENINQVLTAELQVPDPATGQTKIRPLLTLGTGYAFKAGKGGIDRYNHFLKLTFLGDPTKGAVTTFQPIAGPEEKHDSIPPMSEILAGQQLVPLSQIKDWVNKSLWTTGIVTKILKKKDTGAIFGLELTDSSIEMPVTVFVGGPQNPRLAKIATQIPLYKPIIVNATASADNQRPDRWNLSGKGVFPWQ